MQNPEGWSLSEIESLNKIIMKKIREHQRALPSYHFDDLMNEAYIALLSSINRYKIFDTNSKISSWVWRCIDDHFFELKKKESWEDLEYNDQLIHECCDVSILDFFDEFFSISEKKEKQITIVSTDDCLSGGKYSDYAAGVIDNNCNQKTMSEKLTVSAGRVSQINKRIIEIFKPENATEPEDVRQNKI